LAKLDSVGLGDQLVKATNEAADNAYQLSRKAITNAVNLKLGYVDRKVQLKPASKGKPRAEIVANGDITMLSHYGSMWRSKENRWNDPPPGWKIGLGRFRYTPRVNEDKEAGASVEVKSGARKEMPGAFTITKNGKVVEDREGNPLLFIQRSGTKGQGSKTDTTRLPRKAGRAKVQALVGPSVYQLFRTAAQAIEGEVRDDLEARVLRVATEEFEKVLK
jgi:hypothetical protein